MGFAFYASLSVCCFMESANERIKRFEDLT